MKKLAALALAAALMAGCAEPPPESGYVRDRDHRAPYTTTWIQMVCTSYGKNGVCTSQMPIQHTDRHPERWRLMLEDCDGEKCRTGWRTVSEDEYVGHPVGTHYPDAR